MYHKRDFDTLGLCGEEDLASVHTCGDQTIAFHGHPLAGVGGAVVCNPLHLPLATTGWDLARVFTVFPALRDRRGQLASKLSGGEQQMLAIARVLRMGARLLLLDEPTEGLAPILVQQVASILREAKRDGRTVLLVEQNLRFATAVADRHYLLSHGTIVATLGNDDVRARESELRQHLGI